MKSKINVWYLYNSGFVVETESSVLIIDYYLTKASKESEFHASVFSGGVIDINILLNYSKSKPIYVLSSHSHYDHYNPVVLKWKNNDNINYIISYDIKVKGIPDNLYILKPSSSINVNNLEVEALSSNDKGIAFIIKVDGLTILHLGDLNWWYWPSEGFKWNHDIEIKFKNEIAKIKDYNIDLAFIPVDPRLGQALDWTLNYCISNLNLKDAAIFPMHFKDEYSVFEKIHLDIYYKYNIYKINYRGQHFSINN